MASSTVVRALLALGAGGALLTTSSAGYVAWQDSHDAAPSGPSVEAGSVSVQVVSADGTKREVGAGAGVRMVVGDTVTLSMPVTLRTGATPRSVLDIDVTAPGGDAPLVRELGANPTPIRVTATGGGPPLAPVQGDPTAFVVTPASDGHAYRLEWSTSTRATRDGKPPTSKNVWGSGAASLQGLSVGARPLTISLRAGAPASAPTGAATTPAATAPTTTKTGRG